VNKGKGAALHTGIKEATGEYLVIQDADLEYNPNEFNILLKPVLDGFADVGVWLTLRRRQASPDTFLLAYHRQ
jgi:glycosyltransferase involved in cell wall biosynthesis